MTKLIYPENGVLNNCRDNLEAMNKSLLQARSGCNFSVPGSFIYNSYLNNLTSVISGYIKNTIDIKSLCIMIDSSYDIFSAELEKDAKSLSEELIKEREKLIEP